MANSFEAIGLGKSYAGNSVVAGVDIKVDQGEIVGLLGPSGSGKSTIFKMLSGVLNPDIGSVMLNGFDVTKAGIDVRARLGLGYVPQSPELFMGMTTKNNLKIAIEANGQDRQAGEKFLSLIIRTFGLEAVQNQKLGQLSGGQRRLVEIAFAICSKPKFLLLDEPFAGLDPIVVSTITSRIRLLARAGIGIILTDHKVREALEIVSQAYVINNGVMIVTGSAEAVVGNQEVKSEFLGEEFNY